MTTEHPPLDPLDLPDTDVLNLFVGIHPAAGFEDRLITAVRRQPRQQLRLRLVIPLAVQRAAIAAAAVLAVGSVGYLGSQGMNGQPRLPQWGSARQEESNAASIARDASPAINTESDSLVHIEKSSDISRFNGPSGKRPQVGDPNVAGKFSTDSGWWGWPDYTNDGNATNAGKASDQRKSLKTDADTIGRVNEKALSVSDPGFKQNLPAEGGPSPASGTGKENIALGLLGGLDSDKDDRRRTEAKQWGPASKTPPPFVSSGTITKGKVDNLDSILLPGAEQGGDADTTRATGTTAGQQPGGQQPGTPPVSRFAPQSITQTTVSGNTTFLDANGNTVANQNAGSRSLDWISNVGNSAVPGSIAANPADFPVHEQQGQSVIDPLAPRPVAIVPTYGTATSINGEASKVGQSVQFPPTVKNYLVGDNAISNAVPSRLTAPDPKNAAPATGTNNQAAIVVAATAPVVDDRKIIRTGTMEFDVDRFDTAQMQITKIVLELGGFVGATDSQKLPNGKVRGSISVRVPPERLDVLVLSLRALGDLKSQQITAADITKEYTDVQSELAADRAMQDRLLELIHDGKGTVKDLLAAENELGEWRTKIEKAEGMIRYYNGQVALSTLSITLTERDIQTPATAVETETADVGIEAEDVEKARNSALKAIDDVKGRIVEAELKRFDAGQLAARLVADVPPESAGAVIDQLKQLGKVARLEIHRQETNSNSGSNGEAPANNAASGAAPLHTERKPTRLLISIYNLANVAPRRTTNVSLAAADVEAAYTALVAATKSSGGRVVTSTLDRGDPNKATGALVLEFPPEKFDAAMATLHGQGEVLNLSSTENPDTQNSTEAKTGLTVKLISLANVAPRHTTNVALAAGDVTAAYAALINITKSSGGRVVTSNLEQGDPLKANGSLVLELPPEKFDAAMTTLHAQGDVLRFNLMENADTQNSTEAKQGLTVRLIALAAVPPREVVQQTLAAPDVPTAYQAILSAASSTHSRVQSASLNEQDRQNITADIQVEVPRAELADFDKALNAAGGTTARTSGRSADAEGTVDSKVQVKLSVVSADHLAPRETTKLQVEVGDVDKSANDAQAATIAAGGRVLESTISKDHGKGIARIILDFPLDKSADLLTQIRNQGTVRGIDASRDPQAPTGPLAHGQIYVEFRTSEAIVADQTGPWTSIREGLSTSVTGLLWSLKMLVVGLCFIGPWALLGWAGWKFFRRKLVAAKPGV